MESFQVARRLVERQFHVFPLPRNKKKQPLLKNFPELATTNIEQLEKWFLRSNGRDRGCNVGISTTRFNGSKFGLGVDVDCKAFDGTSEVLKLEMDGFLLPPTYTQFTLTGGYHLVYWCDFPVGQRDLAPGINIRAKGGYLVGAGSEIDGRAYTSNDLPVAKAPDWLIERCSRVREKVVTILPEEVDPVRATERAKEYLKTAPRALEGAGGDSTTYYVAARLKDCGVDPIEAVELLCDYWNDECQPPWSVDELWAKVEHAYQYGKDVPGVAAPEAHFEPIPLVEAKVEPEEALHPFKKLNQEFAFVLSGGSHHIVWETKDAKGDFQLRHLNEDSFHKRFSSWTMQIGANAKPVTKLWMGHESRRTFDGFCFRPKLSTPKGFYNLWRGFLVEPSATGTSEAEKALKDYLQHAKENICQNSDELFQWLMGYFAHLVQRPWEKPHTAIVLQGKKGVGKNAFIDRMGFLLGCYYLETANKRHLTGDFNGHLENKLLITLNEAFWSGDKQAEGVLKHLITGNSHIIEHKGQEPFTVDNCARVVIIGNEQWIVPAGPQERRYAVFEVGDGRQQDGDFFGEMQRGMEAGGYGLLLQYLLDFDLTNFRHNEAPKTRVLSEQIDLTLGDFERWWRDSLGEGRLLGSESAEWPKDLEKSKFREAFRRSVMESGSRARLPSAQAVGLLLKRVVPSVDGTKNLRVGEITFHCYRFPDLSKARKEWEAHIGQPVDWGQE